MPTTPLGITYPSLTDAPNGPAQMQSLATATDTVITARTATITQSGTVNVTPVAAAYTTAAVTFPLAFSGTPVVSVTAVVAGGGNITLAAADSVSASGFNAGVVRSNTTVTALMWIAVGPR